MVRNSHSWGNRVPDRQWPSSLGPVLCLPLFATHWLNEDTLILGGSFVRSALSFTTVRKSRNACPDYTRNNTTMSIRLRVHTAVGFPSESGQRGWKVTGRKYALPGPMVAGSASANKRPASRHHWPTSQTPDWSPGRSSYLLPEAAQPRSVFELQTQSLHNQRASQPNGSQDKSREVGQPAQLLCRTIASEHQTSEARSVPGPPPQRWDFTVPLFLDILFILLFASIWRAGSPGQAVSIFWQRHIHPTWEFCIASPFKCYMQLSTTNWYLPRTLLTTEQQTRLPSASTETEPHAAVAIDLQHTRREFRVKWSTLCSRESGGTGL